jgi:hypothetical protein
MRIHSLWESMASIFRTANQGKKEKYICASKISFTILRTNEQHYLSNLIRGSITFHV